jgi:hypothetical protein
MKARDTFTTYVGENVDRLVTLDPKASGAIQHLYSAARALYQGPVCLLAAERIKERVKDPEDLVLLTTGAVISPAGIGETDGPLGTAALARILSFGLQARVIVLAEASLLDTVKGACRGAGLNVVDASDLGKGHEFDVGKVAVIPFPIDDEEAREETARLLSLQPKALIAIEKTGANDRGIYHSYGLDFSSHHSKIDPLFSAARQQGILTIGVGDRGNEVGLGTIKDVARKVHPYGAKCRCACGAGAANTTVVDVVVPATVSNWGGYGIATCLAILLDQPELLHDEAMERRMLRLCADAGAVDGLTGRCELAADGFPEDVHVHLVGLLRTVSKARPRPENATFF